VAVCRGLGEPRTAQVARLMKALGTRLTRGRDAKSASHRRLGACLRNQRRAS
jgi:hypothetical protein